MLILVALVGHAEGGVLSFKDVQIAHLIAAVADGEGDGKGVIQQERLGLGKGGIPGVHVVGDGLGGSYQLGVLGIQSLGFGVGALEDEAVAGIRGEGIGPGLGVGVVGAPVALHEGIFAGAADAFGALDENAIIEL